MLLLVQGYSGERPRWAKLVGWGHVSKKLRGARYSDCGIDVGRWEIGAGWAGPPILQTSCPLGRSTADSGESEQSSVEPKVHSRVPTCPSLRLVLLKSRRTICFGEETDSMEREGRTEQRARTSSPASWTDPR